MAIADISGFLNVHFRLDYLKCFNHRLYFRLVRGTPFAGENGKIAKNLRVARVASGNDNSDDDDSGGGDDDDDSGGG